MRLRATALFAAAAVALTLARAGPAAEREGVAFPERIRVDGQELVLCGTGLLRYRVLFKGYVAALYLEPGTAPDRALSEDVSRRLEIEYFWPISAEQFAEATARGIARNVDDATLSRLRARIERLGRLYRDVESGDRYALTYVPGRGTELSKNGQLLGRIPGGDFATAVFSIWLGSAPLDEGLKARLLGS